MNAPMAGLDRSVAAQIDFGHAEIARSVFPDHVPGESTYTMEVEHEGRVYVFSGLVPEERDDSLVFTFTGTNFSHIKAERMH